ncbi:SHOCT domain-containing protein [Natronobeatus ordinarius]|uniref:SHOCT domain-containing protein n=1 Tax=Natronobeatus ordinarius TaxID=2963433 RepID=UPI0020CEA7EE|nr:SHOCT domain-containing protein [Natronobeatus ordinarius]
MARRTNWFFQSLTAIAAVATLPLGILAGLFVGLTAALAVFVVGWLLLVPTFAILSGETMAVGTDPDEVERWMDVAERAKERGRNGNETADENSLETLRDRYARGELTDEQFEHKLERLLETETLEDVEKWAQDARDERDRNLEYES